MAKSPWLVDAAAGATHKVYTIRTIADFLIVPMERRRICLREFHSWMVLIDGVTEMLTSPGEHAVSRQSLHWETDVFEWMDDGKAQFVVKMDFVKPQSPAEAEPAEGTPPHGS